MKSYTLDDLHELQDDLFGGVERWVEWADWAWGVLRGARLTLASTADEYSRVLGRLLVLRVVLDQYPIFRGWLEQGDALATESKVVQALAWSVVEQEWPVVVDALRSSLADDVLLNTLLFYALKPAVALFDDGEIDYGPYADHPLVRLIDLESGIAEQAIGRASGEGARGKKWIQEGMPLK